MSGRSVPPALRARVLPVHLLGLAAVSVATGLGLWQYDAWQGHRELAAREVTQREPVALDDVLDPGTPFPGSDVGVPVSVTGTWQAGTTFLVSDRERDDTEGWWVVTPVETDGGDGAVLPLVRGWTDDADSLPAEPSGAVRAVAWLQPGEGTGATDDDPTDRVLPQLRMADVVRLVDASLYDGYGVVDAAGEIPLGASTPAPENTGTDGLAAVSPEEVPSVAGDTGLRNLLYAVEWWIFALFAAFVWWRFVKDEVDRAAGRTVGLVPSGAAPDGMADGEDPERDRDEDAATRAVPSSP
ncbi:SURF1 family protein [Nocardioides sp. CPCC 205120]|uniref:SURF1 family protein n=1 Tax=Nocardioides sp. CPCC 205120 TaxID=3406462 RepID=UPI003B50E3A1